MTMKKTIVYILSTNYAGSHFASLLLGSNTRALHIGEVKRLRKPAFKTKKQPCTICSNKPCPVMHGITPENIDDVYKTIFSNIDDENITTLIDTSKKTFWAERFIEDDRYDLKFIHLIRDPRALVRRDSLTFPTFRQRLRQRWKVVRAYPKMALSMLFGEQSRIYLYKWLKENRGITDFIEQNNLDATVVTYHDLAKNTGEELMRLTDWAGLDYEPEQIEYWNFSHHGSQKTDYEWIKKKQLKGHFDLRWKEFLSSKTQDDIVDNKDVLSYLDGIGVDFSAEGLTLITKKS